MGDSGTSDSHSYNVGDINKWGGDIFNSSVTLFAAILCCNLIMAAISKHNLSSVGSR
jgi:hypothetical protein